MERSLARYFGCSLIITKHAQYLGRDHYANISQQKKYPSIGNSQFMKWELKAFVAQAVSSVNKNYNKETFIAEFEKYFSKKGYNINRDIINEIYQIINN